MIVGTWPLDLRLDDKNGRLAFAKRLAEWQLKALREAKLATDWTVRDEAYERAADKLLMALIAGHEHEPVLSEIIAFSELSRLREQLTVSHKSCSS